MIDLSALKTEIQTDQLALGYAPFVASGNDGGLAALFNATSGPGAAQISRTSVTRGAILRGIIPALDQLALGVDLVDAAIPAATAAKWRNRFDALRASDPEITLDASMVGMLQQLVTDKLMPQPYVDAITKRTGSRAEVLFGAGAVVTPNDISEMRRIA